MGAAAPPESLNDQGGDVDPIARALDLIADGETAVRACRKAGTSHQKIWEMVKATPAFAERYMLAREIGTHALADRIRTISEGTDELGAVADLLAAEHVAGLSADDKAAFLRAFENARIQRDRLRVDALKWETGKRLPRVFGDKIDITSGGEVLRPAVVSLPPLDPLPLPPDGLELTETVRTVRGGSASALALAAALGSWRARESGSPIEGDDLGELAPGTDASKANAHNGNGEGGG